ncbi:kinesin-like protein KIN-6 isoform X2 [Amborella trichopoda]|uniref:kinesin-like protein KIN-6 isoform X2 n=1 Tax=Amborella trichopoda TaxID=13333 RepID=UPI0009C19A9E|nr:kinesin-like protein KIN-6 isoform X2 [Amborella trichopoda]|eukprot:XP_020517807.1 kinesin-like protein KIN-6 isoform X2 [Amborella trichopoda]
MEELQTSTPRASVRRNPPRKAKRLTGTPSLLHSIREEVHRSPCKDLQTYAINLKPSEKNALIISEDALSNIGTGAPGISSLKDLQCPPLQDLQTSENEVAETGSLRVFLRIRPPKGARVKCGAPSKTRGKGARHVSYEEKRPCLVANDAHSVTLTTPASLQEMKRSKTEVYNGFAYVFSPQSLQMEVYEKVMRPLVMNFLGGKSRLLVAMGPTGSGKTHTVFGTPMKPGLVPLALHHLFECDENSPFKQSRCFYMSMFEICSERGRGERIFDLAQDGREVFFQQSIIKGLQEVVVSSVAEAESFLSHGISKRTTAVTNANSQSSRSHCIIKIRGIPVETFDRKHEMQNVAVLNIIDLAGAEREKKTGNQGARLLESNFINNTSMVFGLCLRALLEHQKFPKRPFQKHFQNSLLTRYIRDYLEAKKRMDLILTVSTGEDDHVDTSFVLRQASPYANIKYNNSEDGLNLSCQKRHIGVLTKLELPKRRKGNKIEASMNCENHAKVGDGVAGEASLTQKKPRGVDECTDLPDRVMQHENSPSNAGCVLELKRREKDYQVLQAFSKALWNVLKEYKEKLVVSENVIQSLNECLKKEKIHCHELDKDLKDLKDSCSCGKLSSTNIFPDIVHMDSDAYKVACSSHLLRISETVGVESLMIEDTVEQQNQFANTERVDNSCRMAYDIERHQIAEKCQEVEDPACQKLGTLFDPKYKTEELEYNVTDEILEAGPLHCQPLDFTAQMCSLELVPSMLSTSSWIAEDIVVQESSKLMTSDTIADAGAMIHGIEKQVNKTKKECPDVVHLACQKPVTFLEAEQCNLEELEYKGASKILHNKDLSEVDYLHSQSLEYPTQSCKVQEVAGRLLTSSLIVEDTSVLEESKDHVSSSYATTDKKNKIGKMRAVNDNCTKSVENSTSGKECFHAVSRVPTIPEGTYYARREGGDAKADSSKPLQSKWTGRRLLPSSSVFRDLDCLDMEDEVPKVKKHGNNKVRADERLGTQGRAALVRMLRGNRPI